MLRKDTEQRTPEQEQAWLQKMEQQFRQSYHLVKIFYEMNRNEEGRYNHETSSVLFDTSSMPEGMPAALTSMMDPEKGRAEREAWENRTTEIVSSTETWLRILDDGAVEIQYDHTRYDLGYLSPSVDIEDVPEALSAMTCRMREEKEESEEDPIGAYADKVSHSSRTVLRRSQEVFTLRPNGTGGTVEKSGWVQEYDYDGNTTKDSISEPSTFPAGNSEVNGDLMTLRFNMLSKLRYTLNKAVESEAPDHYSTLFTPAARQSILQMALGEIRIAAENGEIKDEKEETRVHGHSEFNGDFIWPIADYSHARTTTDENGRITVEHTHLGQNLDQAYMAGEIEVPPPTPTCAGFGTMMRSSDESRKVVDEWKKSRKKAVGEDAYRAEIKAEVEKLKRALMNNEGSVHGQIRIITIDPKIGIYTYQFAQRIPEGDLHNHTEKTVFEVHSENLQSPSCDELATLLALTI
jgi:hypothetical protein